MSRYFVDSAYFIALVNPNDQLHQRTVNLVEALSGARFVATEEVLTEFLNFYSESGDYMRSKASELTRSVLLDPFIEIISPIDSTFLNALELYQSRPDKGYSLTDCISMNVCKELEIREVLTSDKHFQQEGFEILL
ncbi:PIN domain-containing protein [soil metagenome]